MDTSIHKAALCLIAMFCINSNADELAVCKFPFNYNGVTHNSCVKSEMTGKYWCSLTRQYENKWRYCTETETQYGIDNPVRCAFPFYFKGVKYEACKKGMHGRHWCSITTHFKGLWRYCNESEIHVALTKIPACALPFNYKGKEYSACVKGVHGFYWCSLTRIYTTEWRTCSFEEAETVMLAEKCALPFVYKGLTYTTCKRSQSNGERYWCSLDATYVGKWRFCTNKEAVAAGKVTHPNLVGFWPLTKETTVQDVSGHGHTGVLKNTSFAQGPNNVAGGSVLFQGRNAQSSFEVANTNDRLAGKTGFTMIALIRPQAQTGAGQFLPVMYWQSADGRQYTGFRTHSTYKALYVDRMDANTDQIKYFNTLRDVIDLSTWQSVAFTYDIKGKIARLYRDNVLMFTYPNTTIATFRGGRLVVGALSNDRFYGQISCAQLYNAALDTKQMEKSLTHCQLNDASKDNGKIDRPTIVPNLVALWPLTQHTMARDMSGNQNNGIIRGNVGLTVGPTGVPGGALAFDGVVGSYIVAPNNDGGLRVNTSYTLMTYIYYAGKTSGPVFEWSMPNDRSYQSLLWLYNSNTRLFGQVRDTPKTPVLTYADVAAPWVQAAPNTFVPNQWNKIAHVYDYYHKTNKMYLNDKLLAENSQSSNGKSYHPYTSGHFYFGARMASLERLQGKLFCTQLYSTALSVAEVTKAFRLCDQYGS